METPARTSPDMTRSLEADSFNLAEKPSMKVQRLLMNRETQTTAEISVEAGAQIITNEVNTQAANS